MSPNKPATTLPDDIAAFAEAKVKAGQYGSTDEVLREAMRLLETRDEAIEDWLRDEVAPTCEAVRHGRTGTFAVDDAWTELSARIARDRKASAAE